MDKEAQDFGRQIVSRLDAIKRLILDSITNRDEQHGGSKRDHGKPDNGNNESCPIQAKTTYPKPNPTKPANQEARQQNQERFPRLTQWKPVFEIVGLCFLIGYTTVEALQWCATTEANRISKDTAQRQLRAYIGIEPGALNNFAPSFKTGANFTINNYGQTPAYKVMASYAVGVLPYPYPDNLPLPRAEHQIIESVASIYPHVPSVAYRELDNPISEKQINEILDGSTVRFYVGGIIRYSDIFGAEHCTRFLASAGGARFVEQIITFKKTGNGTLTWNYNQKYNDADCE
jgi:hypothetical protein